VVEGPKIILAIDGPGLSQRASLLLGSQVADPTHREKSRAAYYFEVTWLIAGWLTDL